VRVGGDFAAAIPPTQQRRDRGVLEERSEPPAPLPSPARGLDVGTRTGRWTARQRRYDWHPCLVEQASIRRTQAPPHGSGARRGRADRPRAATHDPRRRQLIPRQPITRSPGFAKPDWIAARRPRARARPRQSEMPPRWPTTSRRSVSRGIDSSTRRITVGEHGVARRGGAERVITEAVRVEAVRLKGHDDAPVERARGREDRGDLWRGGDRSRRRPGCRWAPGDIKAPFGAMKIRQTSGDCCANGTSSSSPDRRSPRARSGGLWRRERAVQSPKRSECGRRTGIAE